MLKISCSCLGLLCLSIAPAFCQEPAATRLQSPERETYDQARQRAQDTPGFKNLQKIGLAFQGYHDIFGHFPPAVVYAPSKMSHSWRVELLPMLKHYVEGAGGNKLHAGMSRDEYDKLILECGYDINRSWDSAANAEVLKHMPEVYRHPTQAKESTESAYYVVKGRGTAFDPHELSSYQNYSDRWVGSTLMVVQSRGGEPWTKPVDVLYSDEAVVPRFGGFDEQGVLGMTCDGAVHFLSDSLPPDDLRALITRDPNDKISIPGIPYRFKR